MGLSFGAPPDLKFFHGRVIPQPYAGVQNIAQQLDILQDRQRLKRCRAFTEQHPQQRVQVRVLRQRGDITEKEYRRAKKYYQNLTGADIVLTD